MVDLRRSLLIAGIALFSMYFILLVATNLYILPEVELECGESNWESLEGLTFEGCMERGGTWMYPSEGLEEEGICSINTNEARCSDIIAFKDRRSYLAMVILGVLTCAVSLYFVKEDIPQKGLLYGGVIAVIYGLLGYNDINIIIVVAIGLLLIGLVLLGSKETKTRKRGTRPKKR